MRSYLRPAVWLPSLHDEIRLGGKAHAHNLATAEPADRRFTAYWNRPDVRGALYAMSGRACAFCQRELPGNDRGDVEHFRPKKKVTGDLEHGGYWWLTYEVDNYLISCRVCNSSRKKNLFPLAKGAVRTTFDNRDVLPTEQRLFLDPSVDPVDDWLRVDWQADLPQVKAGLVPAGDALVAARVAESISLFRLNSDPSIWKPRRQQLDRAMKALEDGDVEQARRLANRYQPHGHAVRQMLEEQTAHGLTLPTPEEELRWHVEALVEDLDDALLTLELDAGSPDAEKLADEAMYALAVIWKSPSAATPDVVQGWLQGLGCDDLIEPLLANLKPAI